MNYAYRTAIKRNKLSAPAKHLLEKDLLFGNILDFGCGRGDDVAALNEIGFKVSGYDPHWLPNTDPLFDEWDIVLCSYVFNIMDKKSRDEVLEQLKQLITPNGKIYIAVRRDFKKGYKTKNGRQYLVKLPLEKVVENNSFCIYKYG